MTNCIRLSENLRSCAARVRVVERPAKTGALRNGVPPKPWFSWPVRCQLALYFEGLQDSDMWCSLYTAAQRWNIFKDTQAALNPWSLGNVDRDFSQETSLELFPTLWFFKIHAGKLFRARVLFLNNTSIHIHTLTLDHTWELQSTITPGCWAASLGKLKEARPLESTLPRQVSWRGGSSSSPPYLWAAVVKTE